MKKCGKCKIYKSPEEFNFKNKALHILQKSCRKCTRQEVKQHYLKNRNYYLIKAKKRNQENRKIIKRFIWDFLISNPCVDCGEKDPIVLDFDHQKDKKIEVSVLIRGNYPLTTLKKEISKCEVRCANCHRRKTAKDYRWYKHQFAPLA